jgi:hypothetical protein
MGLSKGALRPANFTGLSLFFLKLVDRHGAVGTPFPAVCTIRRRTSRRRRRRGSDVGAARIALGDQMQLAGLLHGPQLDVVQLLAGRAAATGPEGEGGRRPAAAGSGPAGGTRSAPLEE